MEIIYNYLQNKTNKDCFKKIFNFTYPSKKQINNWRTQHCINKYCNHAFYLDYCHINKGIYIYKCNCKENYITVIEIVGNYYNYFKSYYYFKMCGFKHYKNFFNYIKYQGFI